MNLATARWFVVYSALWQRPVDMVEVVGRVMSSFCTRTANHDEQRFIDRLPSFAERAVLWSRTSRADRGGSQLRMRFL